MRSKANLLLVSVAMLCVVPLTAASGGTRVWLAPSDRVLFVGSEAFEHRYATAMVETFVLIRFPQHEVDFQHASLRSAQKAFESYNPTMVVLLAGLDPRSCTVSEVHPQSPESAYVRFLNVL